MACRRCQCPLPGFARFCPRCGTPVRRPNRVARLTVFLLVLGGFGFFALVGARSNSSRNVHYQVFPPANFQPTHQSWPTQSPRPGSVRVNGPDGRVRAVEQEVERALVERERRHNSNR
jgi:hypothetical protein